MVSFPPPNAPIQLSSKQALETANVREKEQIYQAASIFLLPSISESLLDNTAQAKRRKLMASFNSMTPQGLIYILKSDEKQNASKALFLAVVPVLERLRCEYSTEWIMTGCRTVLQALALADARRSNRLPDNENTTET